MTRNVATERLTDFQHVLLGLICARPASGYDLKRDLAMTPLGVYQPSSGALYPALRRLEEKGLIRSRAVDAAAVQSSRRRIGYESTGAGRTAHGRWVRMPVEAATISRDLGVHLMRFVMMEPLLARDEVLTFMGSLRDALTAFVATLERYTAAASFEGCHPALALDHGIEIYRASLTWTERAILRLST